VQQKRRSYREPEDDDLVTGDDIASAHERLNEPTRQGARRVALPPLPVASSGPANWAAKISTHQRALEGNPAAAMQVAPATLQSEPAATRQAGPDPSGLENQLDRVNSQISSLCQPYENALDAMRGDLADIGRALTEAMPRRAIEELESEVCVLADRLDHNRQAGAGAPGIDLSAIERGLAAVRNALRHLTPAENLSGFEEVVHALSHKMDQIAASQAQGDPMVFKQIEQAVVSLRGVVSNVASGDALSQLASEVRGLAAQFERAAADSSTDVLAKLEGKITALMESARAVPPELEDSIRALSERLDRMQLSQGDQLALGALEDRIAKLAEKLDASDSRLSQLDSIERGLAELLVHLEEMRNGGGPRGLRAPQPPEPAPQPVAPPPPASTATVTAPVFAQSPFDMMPAALAIEAPPVVPVMSEPQRSAELEPLAPRSAPVDVEPALIEVSRQPWPIPRAPQRQPIDPNLPPDTPLEPGRDVPRVKPSSAAARIAASEAVLAHARPMPAETGGRSAAIAAARAALKAAYLDTPVKVPNSLGRKARPFLNWPFKRKAKDALAEPMPAAAPMIQAPPPGPMPAPVPYDDVEGARPLSRGKRILKFLKMLLIAASVAIIAVGAAQTAMEFLFPNSPAVPGAPSPKDQSKSPAAIEPSSPPLATTPSPLMPTPDSAPPPAPTPAPAPDQTNSIGNKSLFDPSTIIKLPPADVTGSIPRKPALPHAMPAQGRQVAPLYNEALPATIGPELRTAALANDPGADYELGARYAEGRGVPQSYPDAARWFQRAADAGFAPAQFRLASLNEKGLGVVKDLQAARRLYLAAAGKGHAKSMHNLAVLYAEGIDGKPDYKMAADWFLKAAMHGMTDSQFNLAILYARGIGVKLSLAESYRWFAVAAATGDKDAARKRDEVAARLDQPTLAAAKAAVQAFVAEREPEEATSLKAPPGGWDHTPAQPENPRRPAPAPAAPAR
jgi:localization factor PodJL